MNKQGILLVNLGSPDSPAVQDVRRYLREFLMDPRVMDLPWPLRFWIVNGCILPFRPKQSAEAYRSIWWTEGSPLIVISRRVQALLQKQVDIPVQLAMRYQNPSIEEGLLSLSDAGVEEIISVPLFPHYAMSSYETAALRVQQLAKELVPQARVKTVAPYYEHPAYIQALVESARPHLREDFDHLLFSFHGLPERHLRKSDSTGCHCLATKNCCETPSPAHGTCYRAQCFATVRAFARATGLPPERYSVAFQSRLGRDPWMTPYTDKQIQALARGGRKKLLVICPAFVSDCLETLEEIGIRGRETFEHAGGETFKLIPCLNEHPEWVEALRAMIAQHLVGPGEKGTRLCPAAR